MFGPLPASLGCPQKALVRGYTAPALPKAAYSHGLGDKSHQLVMGRESRRIVLRWLEGANPAIGALAAGTVLDTDRWAGRGSALAALCLHFATVS